MTDIANGHGAQPPGACGHDVEKEASKSTASELEKTTVAIPNPPPPVRRANRTTTSPAGMAAAARRRESERRFSFMSIGVRQTLESEGGGANTAVVKTKSEMTRGRVPRPRFSTMPAPTGRSMSKREAS